MKWLRIKPMVPMAQGSGRTSATHKMHALLFTCYLETGSWQGAAALLKGTTSLTADMGTERLLLQCPRLRVADYFPWTDTTLDDLAAAEGNLAEYQGREEIVHMPAAVYAPGALHIVHNCTRDLKSSVGGYSDFIVQLSAVSKMLGRPYLLLRFLNTCCSSGEGLLHRNSFTDVPKLSAVKIYEGRWGTVANAITVLGTLEAPLRACWNKSAFTYRHGGSLRQRADSGKDQEGEEEGGDHDSVRVAAIDGAISNNFFWAYRAMLQPVADCLAHLQRWSETCPCSKGAGDLGCRDSVAKVVGTGLRLKAPKTDRLFSKVLSLPEKEREPF